MGTLMGTPNGEVNSPTVIAKTVASSPHLTPFEHKQLAGQEAGMCFSGESKETEEADGVL